MPAPPKHSRHPQGVYPIETPHSADLNPHAQLDAALVPLLTVAEQSASQTLWATAQGLVMQGPEGRRAVSAVWSAGAHAAACAALVHPVQLRPGLVARCLDDTIVVTRAALPTRNASALSQASLISPLAERTLAAALALGRNVVWTGSYAGCAHGMTQLAATGICPGVWTQPLATPVPEGFVAVHTAQAVWQAGIDRLIAPASMPQDALAMLSQQSGAQAWVCGDRLERALMRLELACGGAAPDAALKMLSSVDLVVVVDSAPTPRVSQIAELVLVDAGYRPKLIFTRGQALAPDALVPVELPSFVDALSASGANVLADDLRHAVQGPPASQAAVPPSPKPSAPPPRAAAPRPAVQAKTAPGVRAKTVNDPGALPMQSQPGWELDRLLEAQPDVGFDVESAAVHAAEAADAASLAAQFGLGPPPAPRVRPVRPSAQGHSSEPPGPPEQMTTQDLVLEAYTADDAQTLEPKGRGR